MVATTQLAATDPHYPASLRTSSEAVAISAWGSLDILSQRRLGLFCSTRCPASLLLPAYDLAAALTIAGVVVVSGFHTPVEQGCLRLLLQGQQPIILCPARSIVGMRLPPAWKPAFEAGRLLILSPFKPGHERITVELAEQRNHFVAALADEVLVVSASKGGKTEQLAQEVASSGKQLYTLSGAANANLHEIGAADYEIQPQQGAKELSCKLKKVSTAASALSSLIWMTCARICLPSPTKSGRVLTITTRSPLIKATSSRKSTTSKPPSSTGWRPNSPRWCSNSPMCNSNHVWSHLSN